MSSSLQDKLSAAVARAASYLASNEEEDPPERARQALERALGSDEDLLTELVFGRMRYLSAELCWELILQPSEVLRGERPGWRPSAIEHHLWPSQRLPNGGEIIPDVVWESDLGTLVIEVKWGDVHTPEQLTREYVSSLQERRPPVLLLAMGHLSPSRRTALASQAGCPHLLALEWDELHASLRRHLALMQATPAAAVLRDIMETIEIRRPSLARRFHSLGSLQGRHVTPGALSRWSLHSAPARLALPVIQPLALTRWTPYV